MLNAQRFRRRDRDPDVVDRPQALAALRSVTADSSAVLEAFEWSVIDLVVNDRARVLAVGAASGRSERLAQVASRLISDRGGASEVIAAPGTADAGAQITAGVDVLHVDLGSADGPRELNVGAGLVVIHHAHAVGHLELVRLLEHVTAEVPVLCTTEHADEHVEERLVDALGSGVAIVRMSDASS